MLDSLKILISYIIWFNPEFSMLSLFLNIWLDKVLSVAFSLDSQYLVTGSADTTINLIDVQNLEVIHTFEEVHSGNKHINIHIYVALQPNIILLIILIYIFYIGWVRSVTFSMDG